MWWLFKFMIKRAQVVKFSRVRLLALLLSLQARRRTLEQYNVFLYSIWVQRVVWYEGKDLFYMRGKKPLQGKSLLNTTIIILRVTTLLYVTFVDHSKNMLLEFLIAWLVRRSICEPHASLCNFVLPLKEYLTRTLDRMTCTPFSLWTVI
jgi:hypothetical protein